MTHGNGVSRGDRNRNARLVRLRELVPLNHAIVGIDLADRKQMVVVCDHDSKVLARKTFRCRAWDLGIALDWAAQRAAAKGFAGATVSCEPTGHRWRVLGQLAADRSMPFACVQPIQTSWARRSEDLTFYKTDEKKCGSWTTTVPGHTVSSDRASPACNAATYWVTASAWPAARVCRRASSTALAKSGNQGIWLSSPGN